MPTTRHEVVGPHQVGRDIERFPDARKKCCQTVKPGTVLGWFRQMAARKYDSSESKLGRPGKKKDIRKLVVEMALANLGWGCTKIRDALRTALKVEIGRTTVANILAADGIEPAPERETEADATSDVAWHGSLPRWSRNARLRRCARRRSPKSAPSRPSSMKKIGGTRPRSPPT